MYNIDEELSWCWQYDYEVFDEVEIFLEQQQTLMEEEKYLRRFEGIDDSEYIDIYKTLDVHPTYGFPDVGVLS